MPISSFQVDVNAPPTVVVERLRAVVGRPPFLSVSVPWWGSDTANPPFVGKVRDNSFTIQRDIRGRNSFLPVLRGRILATPRGTRVEGTMTISLFAAIFVIACFGVIARIMLASNPVMPRSLADPAGFFVGLAFMIVVVAVVAWHFFPEATKARELLTRAVFDPSITELKA